MINNPDFIAKNVMLIEDAVVDQFIATRILDAVSFSEKVIVHSCANDAIKSLKSLKCKSLFPEVIFVDIQMPVKSGFDFLEDFSRLDTELTGDCKIIMLTSSVDSKDYEKAKKSGRVDKMLYKPLTVEMLRNLKEEFHLQLN